LADGNRLKDDQTILRSPPSELHPQAFRLLRLRCTITAEVRAPKRWFFLIAIILCQETQSRKKLYV
jgi:hypothetical protein